MTRPRRNRPILYALYLNAGLLAAVLAIVLFRTSSFPSIAYGGSLSPQPIAGNANLYLMPAQFSQNTWGCYVMDIDAQTLCAYRYFPTNDGANLRLVAARKISYDRKLADFNSDKPSPAEVKQWVEMASGAVRGAQTQPAPNNVDPNTQEKRQ